MKKYNHKEIEKKWKKNWEESGIYKTKEDTGKPKCYVLDMFPYPSGAGLHVGHPKGYIATDVVSRMKMMQGYNVLHPMGWDAYGLPAENYAIKNKVHPAEATEKNIATFKKQLGLLGFTYDWDREVNTTDPKYYKWTQWAFIQMFKKGLAFESNEPINWCPSCQTGLANEDLDNGKCERCGSEVVRKPMRQWVLKITDYADRLLNDIDTLKEWPEPIKEMQRNWIGRSEGALLKFSIKDTQENLEVFTTRPDTLFGTTYCVIAPEHELISKLKDKIENLDEIKKYLAEAKKKSDLERTELQKEKTGVEIKGLKAINPVNDEELPIFVADYVLGGYGTGAIMAVPAHDERDYEFAKKYNLPIRPVVQPLLTKTTGEDAFRDGAPISERNAVVCVIKHWSEDKYLGVHWTRTEWQGFVIGGIEKGEDPSITGVREISEETGYKNVEFVGGLGDTVNARFYQLAKQENRVAHFTPLLFKLKDGEHGEVEKKESDLHKLSWLTKEEMDRFVTHPDMKIIWQRVGGNYLYSGSGILVNSGKFDGMNSEEAKKAITEFVGGRLTANYRLRDWVFSRQRYWGEPIPLVKCEKCGWVPVPEDQLPLELPKVKNYEPSGTGESPLATITDWVNTTCPECGGPGQRETNTMPQWAGSCWYYLRYEDPNNDKALVDKNKEKYWSPIDLYVGGAEHATRHLIYARFWHKFLFDIGVVNYSEPFTRLQNVGLILAEDGRKMSKRWGNVINPDDVVEQFGADSMRLYEMFMGPFDQACAWSTNGVVGVRRFLEKVWYLQEKVDKNVKAEKLVSMMHKTIKKVSDDIVAMRFNTAIAQLMTWVNEMNVQEKVGIDEFTNLILLLSPFAPHVTEELWHNLGNEKTIFEHAWPEYNPELAKDSEITLAVQVNGKLRDTLTVPAEISEADAKSQALASEKVQKWLEGKEAKKVIFVKGKLINFVI